MRFVPFALLFLFSIAFFSLGILERSRQYLLWYSFSFLSFAFAALAQVLIPLGPGLNTMVAAALYMAGALMFGHGVLSRSGRHLGLVFPLSAFVLVVGLVGYYFYFDLSLMARIYTLNLGLAATFLVLGWKARFLLKGNRADQVLLAALLLIGLHFFPRTLLTANSALLVPVTDMDNSVFWLWMQLSLTLLGAAAGLCLLLVTGVDVVHGLRRERNTDVLTGLLNRRGLEAAVATARGDRRDTDRSWVLVCDVDRFKSINDEYGHAAGDKVLKDIARLIRRMARSMDALARVGGEEFVIVMRGCSASKAYAMAECIRVGIETMRCEALPPEHTVTGSFGIAEFRPGEQLWSAVQRGDESLYIAKRSGRNRTVAKGVPLAVA